MDKNAIKKYAVWARRELISRVSQRAALYGITEKDAGDASATSVNGHVLSETEKKQRQALIGQIRSKGYEQVMEEVAYTWFNRFSALRFMEVNGYLPSHVRVFTDDENAFKPQILTEAINLEIDGIDMEKVYALKNANDNDELFKYLIIVQCNALSEILPGMFQRIADYTELLFPDNLLREGSALQRMIAEIPEDNFDIAGENGQVEIIGWLYQYYISERHEEVVDPIYGKEIAKEDVPAATQLFTTDWVVHYIVDNAVGRYWIERNHNSRLSDDLQFYVKTESTPCLSNEPITPQDITVFDPCVGSGHFLVYAFDVLLKIYREFGYNDREAVAEIVGKNLFGLDIDGRAAQLAYFAVMMKGRQYDARFFRRGVQPHIYEIKESNNIDKSCIDYFCDGNATLYKDVKAVIESMKDAKEYGSLLNLPHIDFDRIFERLSAIEDEITIFSAFIQEDFKQILLAAKLLASTYTIVVTNPPYMNKYDAKLKEFVVAEYKDYSGDLFSVFTFRNFKYCKRDGYSGLMTPNVWMFIRMYEKLRSYILENKSIVTLVQMAKGAFFKEATVDICAFVLRNVNDHHPGTYIRLEKFKGDMDVQCEKVLQALDTPSCEYVFTCDVSAFEKIPGSPIAYWATEELLSAFGEFPPLNKIGEAKAGMTTGDNDRFLRSWSEVPFHTVGYGMNDAVAAEDSKCKWFPYNKGGRFRKWYGLNDLVVLWENNGFEIKNATKKGRKIASVRSERLYFKESITWATLTSGLFSARYSEPGHLFDDKGSSAFISHKHLYYVLGMMNSKVSEYVLGMLNPTISFQSGNIGALPIKLPCDQENQVTELVKECISLCKEDWDSYEGSQDFAKSPLICGETSLRAAFDYWRNVCITRFQKLKHNEQKLNEIFINNYGLQLELSDEVEDKDISITIPTSEQVIRDFISYAVGCMFGRYSLNAPGIVFAGGVWDASKYDKFSVDRDNIIPICDDEYFEDDVVGLFSKFVKQVFGEEDYNDNMQFIAESLGGKGVPLEVIREYFLNDFYKDHLNNYSFGSLGKRPIYWLFDSGKKNGFKCLIYIHRYQADTVARIRTDYVHEQQSRYRTAIAELQNRIATAGTSERVRLNKKLKALQDQADEIHGYEEKIHHLADQMISIDLDDGVKKNYAIFQDVLAKIK